MPGSFDCRLPPPPARVSLPRGAPWTSPPAPGVAPPGWGLFAGAAAILGLPVLRIGGLVIGLVGVDALVGLNVSFHDLGAVGEVGLVAVGYAVGPIIVARRLPHLPSIGVVAASLVVTAVAYAPLALRQLPAAMPSRRVLFAVGALAVVCTALAFLLFFALIAEVGPVRATVITYFGD